MTAGSSFGTSVRAKARPADSAAVGPVAAASTGPTTVSFAVAASGDDGDVGVRSPTSNGWPPPGTAAVNTTGSYFTVGNRNAYGD